MYDSFHNCALSGHPRSRATQAGANLRLRVYREMERKPYFRLVSMWAPISEDDAAAWMSLLPFVTRCVYLLLLLCLTVAASYLIQRRAFGFLCKSSQKLCLRHATTPPARRQRRCFGFIFSSFVLALVTSCLLNFCRAAYSPLSE